MEETTNSFKDALKERLTNPFLGKLFLSWIICNWKIPYVTFFVNEERLKINRLEYISNYLNPTNFLDGLYIYFGPLLITAFLIWISPRISNIVYYVSENRRRDRAIKKKKIDNEISGYNNEQILRLQSEVSTLKNQSKKDQNKIKELSLMAEYLSEEPDLINEKDYDESRNYYLEKFRNEISEQGKRDKVFSLLDGYHVRISESYFDEIESKDLSFLITNDILENENNSYYTTKYGEFISKNMLYDKYHNVIPNFNYYTDISD